ncbi:MAG: hypothetical protein AB7F75_12990 [Planctomycetota bacterium]
MKPRAYDGPRLGPWSRRLAVARHTYDQMLRNRWIRHIVFIHVLATAFQAGFILLLGKIASPTSFTTVNEFLRQLNFQWFLAGQTLFNWISANPDVALGTSQNVTLYFLCVSTTLPGTLIALALALPHLICRDKATSAMTVYLSRALGRKDYLIGKAGAVVGLLGVSWILPTLGSWLLGNLLTGDFRFLVWSLGALGHTVAFLALATAFLTILALGISSLSSRDSMVISQFLILWAVLSPVAESFSDTDNPLRHLSFSRNLDEIARAIFNFQNDFSELATRLKLPNDILRQVDLGETHVLMPGLVLLGMAILALVFSIRSTRST